MDTNLQETAINAALKCNWDEAIIANKKILSEELDDVEALNRLARAYYESGGTAKAKKTTLKVLKIDPINNIAQKALEKYKTTKDAVTRNDQNVSASDFIEEIGTTKQTSLFNLCSIDTISSLDSGDEVFLSTHTHRVTVTNKGKKYLGKLPDDLSARLRLLTKNGYKYRVLIMSANKDCIKIFIKELTRGKGYESMHSFPRDPLESIGEQDS